jgi:hypothetical protein
MDCTHKPETDEVQCDISFLVFYKSALMLNCSKTTECIAALLYNTILS